MPLAPVFVRVTDFLLKSLMHHDGLCAGHDTKSHLTGDRHVSRTPFGVSDVTWIYVYLCICTRIFIVP